MSPMKAIQSATLEASKLLKIDDRLGTLEVNKIADIVAMKGNPIEDIRATRNVVFVMKEGVVYKSPTTNASSDTNPFQIDITPR